MPALLSQNLGGVRGAVLLHVLRPTAAPPSGGATHVNFVPVLLAIASRCFPPPPPPTAPRFAVQASSGNQGKEASVRSTTATQGRNSCARHGLAKRIACALVQGSAEPLGLKGRDRGTNSKPDSRAFRCCSGRWACVVHFRKGPNKWWHGAKHGRAAAPCHEVQAR